MSNNLASDYNNLAIILWSIKKNKKIIVAYLFAIIKKAKSD